NEALERNSSVPKLAPIMNEVKLLLPASEEVEFIGATVRVDNAWLHEALDNVVKNGEDAAGHRLPMLGEISARLARLRQSVKAAQMEEDGASQYQRARLDEILARPEYQPEKKRESMIGRWIRGGLRFIAHMLSKLFAGSRVSKPLAGSSGLVMVLRVALFLIVTAALIFGSVKLAQLFQGRKKPAEKAKTREALGEEIPEDATATDMLALA